MSNPFSRRIFVADGDPDGLRVVERSNWIGEALIFPRALLPKVKQRDELGQTGVYLLLGPRDDGEGEKRRIHCPRPRPPRRPRRQRRGTRSFCLLLAAAQRIGAPAHGTKPACRIASRGARSRRDRRRGRRLRADDRSRHVQRRRHRPGTRLPPRLSRGGPCRRARLSRGRRARPGRLRRRGVLRRRGRSAHRCRPGARVGGAQDAPCSRRKIFAPSTIARSFAEATSRGKYFMPQSGARMMRSLAT